MTSGPEERTLIIMTNEAAEVARLMKVTDAVVAELERQGVAEPMSNLGFSPAEMAKAVIKAADAKKNAREEYLKAVREAILALHTF